MSLASGESKSSGNKKSWLPLGWGVRFTIAVTGFIVTFGLMLRGGTEYVGNTPIQWLLAKTFLEGAVLLFFPLWVVKLLWEQVRSWTQREPTTAQATPLVKKERWLTGKKVGFLIAPVLILPVFEWAVDFVARNYLPYYADRIFLWSNFAALVVIAIVITPVLLEGIHEPAPSGASGQSSSAGESAISRRKWKRKLTSWLTTLIFLGVLISPISWKVKIGLLATALIYPQVLLRIKLWTYGLVVRGEFDRALRLNRIWLSLPLYGGTLEGPILFESGRYADARAFVKPKAFDAQGNPLLKSAEFYIYALALVNDGHEAEAEKLLREAVQAPQCKGGMKVALAACLLTLCKEPDYARKLMEEAMAGPQRPITAFGERADRARRVAQYGWALASCGSRQESEARIQEALGTAAGLNGSDLAGVHYFVGEAWRAMGDTTKARAAFQEAVTLSPVGVTALSVQKALAKMDGKWNARQFQN